MDISIVKDNSIKIKGNKSAIVIDPISKTQGEIVICTSKNDAIDTEKVEGKRLIIHGPGEYEVGGISLVVKTIGKNSEIADNKDLIFNIVVDSLKTVFLPSTTLGKIEEEDEYDLVIIQIKSQVSEDLFSKFNTKYLVLYGDLNFVNLKTENVVKTNKINLKKNNEYAGKVILLDAHSN